MNLHATTLTHSGRVRPRQGTEICNFGAPSPLIYFWNFLQWIIFFFLQVFCLIEEIAPRCGKNSSISGRRKKRRIVSRLWLSWFFSVPTHTLSMYLNLISRLGAMGAPLLYASLPESSCAPRHKGCTCTPQFLLNYLSPNYTYTHRLI